MWLSVPGLVLNLAIEVRVGALELVQDPEGVRQGLRVGELFVDLVNSLAHFHSHFLVCVLAYRTTIACVAAQRNSFPVIVHFIFWTISKLG